MLGSKVTPTTHIMYMSEMLKLQAITGKLMEEATLTSIKLATSTSAMSTAYDKLMPLLEKFTTLIGDLALKVLPPLIDGLIRLLNLIPGLGPDTAAATSERLNTGAGVIGGAVTGAAPLASVGHVLLRDGFRSNIYRA